MRFGPGVEFPDYLIVVGDSVPVGLINYLPHAAQSNYHSVFVKLEHRLRYGIAVLSSYTFARAITNAPQWRNAGGPNGSENAPAQDSLNLRAERGLAYFHTKNRWVTSFLYDLPVASRRVLERRTLVSALLADWQIAGIMTMQSGFPFTVNVRGDTAGVGGGTGGIAVRPDVVPSVSPSLPGSQRNTGRFFNTGAFSLPAAYTFGNVGRNTVIGPGLVNLDVAISKAIHRTGTWHLQLRAETFNVVNHPNYNLVGRLINDPTFGQILSQLDPRQIQLAVRLEF